MVSSQKKKKNQLRKHMPSTLCDSSQLPYACRTKIKLEKTNSKPMQQLLALHEFHNCAYFLEKKVFKKSKFLKKKYFKGKKNPERIYWFSNLKMAFAIL